LEVKKVKSKKAKVKNKESYLLMSIIVSLDGILSLTFRFFIFTLFTFYFLL